MNLLKSSTSPNMVDFGNPEIKSVILGDHDPRGLSIEEFSTLPGLLYHGSHSDFEFKRDYDYTKGHRTLVSMTLGYGLYLGAEKDVSTEYSVIRKKNAIGDYYDEMHLISANPSEVYSNDPFSKEFAVYKGNFINFRNITGQNHPVGKSFVDSYYEFIYNTLLGNKSPTDRPNQLYEQLEKIGEMGRSRIVDLIYPGSSKRNNFEQWNLLQFVKNIQILRTSMNSKDLVGLRTIILGENYNAKPWDNFSVKFDNTTVDLNELSLSWGVHLYFFTEFMKQSGIDGIIYNERSEKERVNQSTYMIYNLEKIGDYQTWQAEDGQDTSKVRAKYADQARSALDALTN